MSSQRAGDSGSSGGGQGSGDLPLTSLTVSQRFEWTGLAKPNNEIAKDEVHIAKQQKTEGSHENARTSVCASLTDLTLWHVLGYAIDESNYWNLSLVCREWHEYIARMEPPAVFRMWALMEPKGGTRVHSIINVSKSEEILRIAFDSTQTLSSPLYRAAPMAFPEGSESEEDSWPYLQPQFSLILMRFVHALCTQRPPFNASSNVYSTTKDFVESFSERVVGEVCDLMSSSLERMVASQPSRDDGVRLLSDLLGLQKKWDGLVRTVMEITGYLDRYYIKHHGLASIDEVASVSLANALVGRLGLEETEEEKCTPYKIIRCLSPVLKSIRLTQNEKSILLRFSDVCKDLFDNVTLNDAARHTKHAYSDVILPCFRGVEGESDSQDPNVVATGEAPVKFSSPTHDVSKKIRIVTTPENDAFSMLPHSHLVSSSGLLGKLHLQGGETIRLNVRTVVMEKTIEFYRMEEEEPMPNLATPLASSDMADLVGPRYAAFVDGLSQVVLFELITFANLMEMKSLLDLGCCKTAAMLKGKTAEEIRELFNITNDFSPEEEEQVREENGWVEGP